MKKVLPIFAIIFLVLCPNAQSQFYGENHDVIENQQNEILKKEKVKKIKSRHYELTYDERILCDNFIVFDSLSNVKETIYQDDDNKRIHSYTYDKFNNLLRENIIDENFKSKKYNKPSAYGTVIMNFSPNYFIYKYDSINRLVKKNYCDTNDKCKSDYLRYHKNKVYRYYQGTNGKLDKTEVIERKGNIEIKLEINQKNEIIQKSIISYSSDSLKLKEERFKRDTLVYREQNTIENNKIVKTIKSYYYKKENSNNIEESSQGKRFVFNSDSSIKEIFSYSLFLSRDEFLYNKKGLLSTINTYIDDKLRYSTKYKYNMW